MRLMIFPLVLSLCALGLAAFSTVRSFDDNGQLPVSAVAPTPGWTEAECESARMVLPRLAGWSGDPKALSDMIQAINDNCP